jgi:hypothetical protein
MKPYCISLIFSILCFTSLFTVTCANANPISFFNGLYYLETMPNGTARMVIQKNIVVLTKKNIPLPEGTDEKTIEKIERENKRINSANEDKLYFVKKELEKYFGLPDIGTKNSQEQRVFFIFNIIEEKVGDTKSLPLAKALSNQHALVSSVTNSSGGFVTVPATVITTYTTNGFLGRTLGHIICNTDNAKEGTLAHEVGHTLSLDDNYGGLGISGSGYGLMGSQPIPIAPDEVDLVILKSLLLKKQ